LSSTRPANQHPLSLLAALAGQPPNRVFGRHKILELGGPEDLTFNQFAITVQQATGRAGTSRHIPRLALRMMALGAAGGHCREPG
jgi:uncharacterized protein YbjT (DUF2867 family)